MKDELFDTVLEVARMQDKLLRAKGELAASKGMLYSFIELNKLTPCKPSIERWKKLHEESIANYWELSRVFHKYKNESGENS